MKHARYVRSAIERDLTAASSFSSGFCTGHLVSLFCVGFCFRAGQKTLDGLVREPIHD